MLNHQKTLKNRVSCQGIGLHSGKLITLSLLPAPANSGINFVRSDIKDKDNVISACYLNVVSTNLGTNIANDAGVNIATIEHLMAALWGCGVDNCTVEINGPEVPIMDGSSEPFVFLIECAGIKTLAEYRKLIEILKPIKVEENTGGYLSIKPASCFSVGLEIDFGDKIIANQTSTYELNDTSFKRDLSRARTFCFESEVDKMRELGLARGGSLDNAIVVNNDGVINKHGLRYSNEFVRHKILDCIGDSFLCGSYIKGEFQGFKSGHGLNNKLLRELFKDDTAWRYVQAAS